MRTLAIYTLLAFVASVGIFASGYFAGWESMAAKYTDLATSVKVSNQLAAEKLKTLIKDRDSKQAEIDLLAAEREKLDAQAKSEIERLSDELSNRPVRVRVITKAGSCGRGSGTGKASDSENSKGNAGPPYGVLPKENTRRLRAALSEVETLSAAYNSCKASYRSLSVY